MGVIGVFSGVLGALIRLIWGVDVKFGGDFGTFVWWPGFGCFCFSGVLLWVSLYFVGLLQSSCLGLMRLLVLVWV